MPAGHDEKTRASQADGAEKMRANAGRNRIRCGRRYLGTGRQADEKLPPPEHPANMKSLGKTDNGS
jgi:hypothetical protein